MSDISHLFDGLGKGLTPISKGKEAKADKESLTNTQAMERLMALIPKMIKMQQLDREIGEELRAIGKALGYDYDEIKKHFDKLDKKGE